MQGQWPEEEGEYLDTIVGKDMISRGHLQLQVAGEGHADHVQEQRLADTVHHGQGYESVSLGSAAKEQVRGGAVADKSEAVNYDKYPVHDLSRAQEYCGRSEEVTVSSKEDTTMKMLSMKKK